MVRKSWPEISTNVIISVPVRYSDGDFMSAMTTTEDTHMTRYMSAMTTTDDTTADDDRRHVE